MKKLILVTMLLAGCKSKEIKDPACAIQETMSSALSNAIASNLECSNVAAIKEDINLSLGKLNMCAATAKGPVGGLLCPLISKSITDVVKNAAPSKWECKVSDTSKLSQVISDTCSGVIKF